MKVIEQSVECLGLCPRTLGENLKRAESFGRICYKSEDKIEDGTALPFCQKYFNEGHNTIIEHTNLVLRHRYGFQAMNYIGEMCHPVNSGRHYFDAINCIDPLTGGHFIYIGGSYRAWAEWFNLKDLATLETDVILNMLGWDICRDGDFIPLEVERASAKFITDRAVTHEMVRHRPGVFLQESQRYCRYDQGKFGKEVTFIAPTELFGSGISDEYIYWEQAMEEAEQIYFKLLDMGVAPQAARLVLPNSCKTEIAWTAPIWEWMHAFKLRCSKAAMPMMRVLMTETRDTFHENCWWLENLT